MLITACIPPSSHAADSTWHVAKGPLLTKWAALVSPTNALPDYPQPQFERDTWQNLNGLWDYGVTDKGADRAPAQFDGQILVPFPIESALSGVMKALLPTQRLWYHRTFDIPAGWAGKHVLLHFGAVDWDTSVYVNGRDLGSHRGGYDAFSFDITNALHATGPQDIVVSVLDPSDTSWQLHGKQVLHPGGASYTAASGIWQTVWIEPVAPSHLDSLHMVTDTSTDVLHLTVDARIFPHPMKVHVDVLDGSTPIVAADQPIGAELGDPDVHADLTWYKATNALVTTTVDIPIKNAHLWSPDDPFLYNLNVTLIDSDGTAQDTVHSYVGMRTLTLAKDSLGNVRLYVNGKVTMLPMVLDQGYWPDGIYTAPTDDALKFDIEAEHTLGVYPRKHVKVEPDRWYYWADKLGVMVLQDMPTGNDGDPFTDTETSPEAGDQYLTEVRHLIEQRWNHPAIISWDMFNEGWGQHDTVKISAWAKQLDPTRLIDEASGFPWHNSGDIRDCHGGTPAKSDHQISIDTENGSVGLRSPGHDWPIGALWTPRSYNPATGAEDDSPIAGKFAVVDDHSKAWFTNHVRALYKGLWANSDRTGQTGDSYCQIVDVETEEDGLISYDRAVWKVDAAPISAAAHGLLRMATNVKYVLPTAAVKPTVWSYVTVKPGEKWNQPGFNDSAWKTGKSAFGQGYDYIHTPWTDTPGDIWLRKDVTLAGDVGHLEIRMIHDEDVEVYVNGVLAARDAGFISAYDDFPISPDAAATIKPGKNLIAVHCLQTTGGQVIDVGLIDTASAKGGK
jgi:hypothetical protein